MNKKVYEAKAALDSVINKSRVHLYKPIQIAEILFHHRTEGKINLLDLEEYRTESKKWRDEVSSSLLGRKCTSSAKFQDNLFDNNAIPPRILNTLGEENIRTNGAVEAYIYRKFYDKHKQLSNALGYCINAEPSNFMIKEFIDSFWNEAGLRRSLDKIYEIVVYSLFSTLVEALDLKVEISVDENSVSLLEEFEDFSQKVMCLDTKNTKHIQEAMIYRVGVTNAADRGLDMYSNWGPAIQIKHLSLGLELAEDIVTNISSDRIVIVCKDADKKVIVSLLTQIGWRSRIQSIVTENDLIIWYEKALRGKYADILSNKLLSTLGEELSNEFPSINFSFNIWADRGYSNIHDDFWA